MRRGLIGHTGFVGSNLARAATFEDHYNSTNYPDLVGRSFDLLVCAGVTAAKWAANRDPEADRQKIRQLTAVLEQVSVREFILISTIDVYPNPEIGGDEDTAIQPNLNHAYGKHRYELEAWAAAFFPQCRIVRLPALFGPNLKKNALYDLLHGNEVASINPAARFQWYPLKRLWQDIDIARRLDLRLVNLFTEPVRMSQVIERFFPGSRVGPERLPAPDYRLSTSHARAFGGADEFLMSAEACLEAIGGFVAGERGGR